jgi:hypothetical protein
MPRTQARAGRRGVSGAAQPLVPLAAVMAACYVTACGGGAAPAASGTPASTATPARPAAPSGQDAASPGTPAGVLADWMHQVAAGDRSGACQEMRQPGLTAQRSAAACMSARGTTILTALHGNFVTDGIRPGTPISITAPATGTSVTISGRDIHLSGTTLDLLMAAHSTGVKPGQLAVSFGLSRIDGAWYVTDMNIGA